MHPMNFFADNTFPVGLHPHPLATLANAPKSLFLAGSIQIAWESFRLLSVQAMSPFCYSVSLRSSMYVLVDAYCLVIRVSGKGVITHELCRICLKAK